MKHFGRYPSIYQSIKFFHQCFMQVHEVFPFFDTQAGAIIAIRGFNNFQAKLTQRSCQGLQSGRRRFKPFGG